MPAVEPRPLASDLSTRHALTVRDAVQPRSSLYPNPDHYSESYGALQQQLALATRASAGPLRPLAVHLEIPFCRSLCLHCSRNTIVTHDRQRADTYLDLLEVELRQVMRHLDPATPIVQWHLAGGSANFLQATQLQRLRQLLQEHFRLTEHLVPVLSADPQHLTTQRLAEFRELGMGALYLSLPDLDNQVQQALQRRLTGSRILAQLNQARRLGYREIRVELLLGLPHQSPESLRQTLQRLLGSPIDLIRLRPYWHLPERYAAHRQLQVNDLPPPPPLWRQAREQLLAAGWHHLGLDNFVPAGSALLSAYRQGRLRLDAQGYQSSPETDRLGLGLGAISRLGGSYAQNHRRLTDYQVALEHQLLPVQRGHVMSTDDLARHSIMQALFCQGEVHWQTIAEDHLLNWQVDFRHEQRRLHELADQGLVWIETDAFGATAQGQFALPRIAAVFDRYARHGWQLMRHLVPKDTP